MGLAWQQGPLAIGSVGHFLTEQPLPPRLLYAAPLRRHPADADHRVDIRPTSRQLVVSDGQQMIADTQHPALYESGFAPRWYVSRDDIDEVLGHY